MQTLWTEKPETIGIRDDCCTALMYTGKLTSSTWQIKIFCSCPKCSPKALHQVECSIEYAEMFSLHVIRAFCASASPLASLNKSLCERLPRCQLVACWLSCEQIRPQINTGRVQPLVLLRTLAPSNTCENVLRHRLLCCRPSWPPSAGICFLLWWTEPFPSSHVVHIRARLCASAIERWWSGSGKQSSSRWLVGNTSICFVTCKWRLLPKGNTSEFEMLTPWKPQTFKKENKSQSSCWYWCELNKDCFSGRHSKTLGDLNLIFTQKIGI